MTPLGFVEWKDAFNVENIPSTRLHKAFHIQFQNVRGDSLNQSDYESTALIELKHLVKGQVDTDSSVDLALKLSEDIIVALLDPTERLNNVTIKRVFVEGFDLAPIDVTNDNSILVTMQISFLLSFNVDF